MKTETANPLRDYYPYQADSVGMDRDGKAIPTSYYLTRSQAPRIPRETEVSPWPTLAAGILLGLGLLLSVLGLADVVRWLTGG